MFIVLFCVGFVYSASLYQNYCWSLSNGTVCINGTSGDNTFQDVKLNYSDLLNVPSGISDTNTFWSVDDWYLNNVSAVLTFNETLLNSTIVALAGSDGNNYSVNVSLVDHGSTFMTTVCRVDGICFSSNNITDSVDSYDDSWISPLITSNALNVSNLNSSLTAAIPTNLSQLVNDTNFITDYTETDPVFSLWGFDYSFMVGVPENLSQFSNDTGFITDYTETDPVWITDKPSYVTLNHTVDTFNTTEEMIAATQVHNDTAAIALKLVDVISANTYIDVSGTTNKTLTFSETVLNETIAEALETTYYNITNITTTIGSSVGLIAYADMDDDDYFNVSEIASDMLFYVNYSNVDTFNQLIVKYRTIDGEVDDLVVSIYNCDSTWSKFETLVSTDGLFHEVSASVQNPANYVCNNFVAIRFEETNIGSRTDLWNFDWITISQGISSIVGVEADPLAIHKTGDTPLTGNWDGGAFNISAEQFLGSLNCSNIIGGTDGDYCADASGSGGNTTEEMQWAVAENITLLQSNINGVATNLTNLNKTGAIEALGFVTGGHTTNTVSYWTLTGLYLYNDTGNLNYNDTMLNATITALGGADTFNTTEEMIAATQVFNYTLDISALTTSNASQALTLAHLLSSNSSIYTTLTHLINSNITLETKVDNLNATKGGLGDCAVGTVVENITLTGVECITSAAGVDTFNTTEEMIAATQVFNYTLDISALTTSNTTQGLTLGHLLSSNTSIYALLTQLTTSNTTQEADIVRLETSNTTQATAITNVELEVDNVNATKGGLGDCGAGDFIQNITLTGVECLADVGGAYDDAWISPLITSNALNTTNLNISLTALFGDYYLAAFGNDLATNLTNQIAQEEQDNTTQGVAIALNIVNIGDINTTLIAQIAQEEQDNSTQATAIADEIADRGSNDVSLQLNITNLNITVVKTIVVEDIKMQSRCLNWSNGAFICPE